MLVFKTEAKTLRQEGDRARDQREWAAAAEHYTSYLALRPGDAAIWVQLGHAVKEQGLHAEAESAYRKALDLSPDDADGHLQLGHVLKLQNRSAEARDAYSRSLELAPTAAAHGELVALGAAELANSTLEASTTHALPTADGVLFEIDDLLGYLRAHKTLSGIQRVQVGIVSSILATRAQPGATQYAFVRTQGDRGGSLWQLRVEDLNEIISHATGPHVSQATLVRLLDRAEQNAVPIKPGLGQAYVILGAFWGFNNDATRFSKLKSTGVSLGVYIYDLIPLTHPEYCNAHLVSEFAMAIGDGFAAFDFILAISEYTAEEIRRMQRRYNLRPVPVAVVPLAHVLKGEVVPTLKPIWASSIAALRDRPFVLMVSTIEGRKNHPYLVAAWKILLEEGLDPPDLVFVGRYGWRVNDFMEQLQAGNYLNGRLHVLHDLSDGELTTLYQACLFTAFPSIVEGWGLPVGESLAHGCPCVASNTTSIPEVGGDFVDYIDPYNLRGGVEVLRKMAFNDDYRAQRRKQIATGFKPRMWNEVAEDFLSKVVTLRKSSSKDNTPPLLKPGELFVPGDFQLGRVVHLNYPSRALRPILLESWYPIESFGVWMRGVHGKLRFLTELPQDTAIMLYFSVAGAPWSMDQRLSITAGPRRHPASTPSYPRSVAQLNHQHLIMATKDVLFREPGKIGVSGIVEVEFNVMGDSVIPDTELREFFVGLVGFTYCATSDTALRTDIAETFMSGTFKQS